MSFVRRTCAAILVASLCLTSGMAWSESAFKGKLPTKPGTAITWGKTITLTPPDGAMGRYPRLAQVKFGAHSGDLLLTYQTKETGGDFMMYRSSDKGQTWTGPSLINKATTTWNFASCNIIQLEDGRLLMTMQRRRNGTNIGGDSYIDIAFSSDGGQTWGSRQQIFQGANWEGRAIQVPHDANGDGFDDIYLFFTQSVIPTTRPAKKAFRGLRNGLAVSFIASYDGGKTWGDSNPERFTGKIIHRDFNLRPGGSAELEDHSSGGMPQPFLLPNNRVGVVVEETQMTQSPYIVANDPGDWDWNGKEFKGPWTSADYDGTGDRNVYPTSPQNAWPATTTSYGNGPYASVLPDGRIIMASRNEHVVSVWLGDKTAHGFEFQDLPFGRTRANYPFVEPISDNQILVAGGSPDAGDNFILLRFGTIN